MRIDREQPRRLRRQHQCHPSEFQSHAGQQRQQLPRHPGLAQEPQKVTRDIQKREGPKVPQILFVRDRLPHQSTKQPRRRRHRHPQPFVPHQRGNSNDRATNRTNDAPSQQTHEKRPLQGQIGEPVRKPDHPQRHANNQRRRHEQHQLQLLIGITFLRE